MTKQYRNKIKEILGIGDATRYAELEMRDFGSYSVQDAVEELQARESNGQERVLLTFNSLDDRQQELFNSRQRDASSFYPAVSQAHRFCEKCIRYNWDVCRECKYD